jgi:mono/diheme cytochrome c family protein
MRARSILLFACIAACDASAESESSRGLPREILAARDRMHVRFAAAPRIRLAIALGDLPRAQSEARTIAALDEPAAPAGWRRHLDGIRAAAAGIASARDAGAAARMFATLGGRCAQCHQATAARIAFAKLTRPDDKLSELLGHDWAATEMWQGLIGPSGADWHGGARTLGRVRLTVGPDGEVPGHPLGTANDIAHIRLFAARAQNASGLDERSALYGELLVTCAHCHAVIRDRASRSELTPPSR